MVLVRDVGAVRSELEGAINRLLSLLSADVDTVKFLNGLRMKSKMSGQQLGENVQCLISFMVDKLIERRDQDMIAVKQSRDLDAFSSRGRLSRGGLDKTGGRSSRDRDDEVRRMERKLREMQRQWESLGGDEALEEELVGLRAAAGAGDGRVSGQTAQERLANQRRIVRQKHAENERLQADIAEMRFDLRVVEGDVGFAASEYLKSLESGGAIEENARLRRALSATREKAACLREVQASGPPSLDAALARLFDQVQAEVLKTKGCLDQTYSGRGEGVA